MKKWKQEIKKTEQKKIMIITHFYKNEKLELSSIWIVIIAVDWRQSDTFLFLSFLTCRMFIMHKWTVKRILENELWTIIIE